jgi:hypothetical protein
MSSPEGEMCEWLPASASLSQALTATSRAAEANTKGSVHLDKAPIRQLKDTYPTYSAIAQDARTGDIFMQDENLFGIRVFDRMTDTPPNAAFSEPKRYLGGHSTKLEFNCGLYIDPNTGDIYSVNNDTTDTLVIFEAKAEGDVPPNRELKTPHGTYGIAVDERNVPDRRAHEFYRGVSKGRHRNRQVYSRNQGPEDTAGGSAWRLAAH